MELKLSGKKFPHPSLKSKATSVETIFTETMNHTLEITNFTPYYSEKNLVVLIFFLFRFKKHWSILDT